MPSERATMLYSKQLKAAYRDENVILFVGNGVSMSLGLSTWSELIDYMARELDFDEAEFRQYGSYLSLAEYFRLQHGTIGPLRSWMDRNWHSGDIDIGQSRLHELIVKGNFKQIYTTNYDQWLENAFDYYRREYVKVVNVEDLARIRPDVTQIIKFHGDFSDDASIVLDETSYFERLEFESPLDIKLRSDALGRSVIFIGYSLADINIRYLFYKLTKLWKNSSRGFTRPKSYIFTPKKNPIQEAVLAQWGIEMITSEIEDPSAALENFLAELIA
jgi:hypothetical protein